MHISSSLYNTIPFSTSPSLDPPLPAITDQDTVILPTSHPCDRLKNYLIEKRFLDDEGNITPILKAIPLPQIDREILSKIEAFLTCNRGLQLQENFTINFCLQNLLLSLIHFTNRQCHQINLVGGTLYYILGINYFIKCLNTLGIEDHFHFLDDDFIKKIHSLPSDNDIRFVTPQANYEDLKNLSEYLITLFTSEFQHLTGGSYLFEDSKTFIRQHAFHKYKHIKKGDLHYFVNTLKDSFVTEILFVQKLQREFLFTLDAISFDLFPYVMKDYKNVCLKTCLDSLWTPLIHRLIGIIDTSDAHTIDAFGFPMYISHLMKGSVCLKSSLEKEIVINFKNNYLTKAGNITTLLLLNLDKVISNHFQNDDEIRLIYYFNVITFLNSYLSTEELFNLRKLIADHFLNIKLETKAIFSIYECLIDPSLSLETVENFYILSSLLFQGKNVSLREHCGSTLIQLKLFDKPSNVVFLLRENFFNTLDNIFDFKNNKMDFLLSCIFESFDQTVDMHPLLLHEKNIEIILGTCLSSYHSLCQLGFTYLKNILNTKNNSYFLYSSIEKIPFLKSIFTENNFVCYLRLLTETILSKHLPPLSLSKETIDSRSCDMAIQQLCHLMASVPDAILNRLSVKIYPRDKSVFTLVKFLIPHNPSFAITILKDEKILHKDFLDAFHLLITTLSKDSQKFAVYQEIITSFFHFIFSSDPIILNSLKKEIELSLQTFCSNCIQYKVNKKNKQIIELYKKTFDVYNQDILLISLEELITLSKSNVKQAYEEWLPHADAFVCFESTPSYHQFLLTLFNEAVALSNYGDVLLISNKIQISKLLKKERNTYHLQCQSYLKSLFQCDDSSLHLKFLIHNHFPIQDIDLRMNYELIVLRKKLESGLKIKQEYIAKLIKIRAYTFKTNMLIHLVKCHQLALKKLKNELATKTALINYADIVTHDFFYRSFPLNEKKGLKFLLIYLQHSLEGYLKKPAKTYLKPVFNILKNIISHSSYADILPLLEKILLHFHLFHEKKEPISCEIKSYLKNNQIRLAYIFQKSNRNDLVLSLFVFLQQNGFKNLTDPVYLNAFDKYLCENQNISKNTIDAFVVSTKNFSFQHSHLNIIERVLVWLIQTKDSKNSYFWMNKWFHLIQQSKVELDHKLLTSFLEKIYAFNDKDEFYNLMLNFHIFHPNVCIFWQKIIEDFASNMALNKLSRIFTLLIENLSPDLFDQYFSSSYTQILKKLSISKSSEEMKYCLKLMNLKEQSHSVIDINAFTGKIFKLKKQNDLKKGLWDYACKFLLNEKYLSNSCEDTIFNLYLCLIAADAQEALLYFSEDHLIFKFLTEKIPKERFQEACYKLCKNLIKASKIENVSNELSYYNYILEYIDQYVASPAFNLEKYSKLMHLFIHKFISYPVAELYEAIGNHLIYMINNDTKPSWFLTYFHKYFISYANYSEPSNNIIMTTKKIFIESLKLPNINIEFVLSAINKNKGPLNYLVLSNCMITLFSFDTFLDKLPLKTKKILSEICHKCLNVNHGMLASIILNLKELYTYFNEKEYEAFWASFFSQLLKEDLNLEIKMMVIESLSRSFLDKFLTIFSLDVQHKLSKLYFQVLIRVCDDLDCCHFFYPMIKNFMKCLLSSASKGLDYKELNIHWYPISDEFPPLPCNFHKVNVSKSLTINYYAYIMLLAKAVIYSSIKTKRLLILSDKLCANIFESVFLKDPNLITTYYKKQLVIDYIVDPKYFYDEEMWDNHARHAGIIYINASKSHFFDLKDHSIQLVATLEPANISGIPPSKHHSKEFIKYVLYLIEDDSRAKFLQAFKVLKSNKNNYLNVGTTFKVSFFNRALSFLSKNLFFDSNNLFCYSYLLEILFQNGVIVGKDEGGEILLSSIVIFNKIFDALISFKLVDSDDIETKKLQVGMSSSLAACFYLAIKNEILNNTQLDMHFERWVQSLEHYLLITGDFYIVEDYLQKIWDVYKIQTEKVGLKSFNKACHSLKIFAKNNLSEKALSFQVFLEELIKNQSEL